MNWQRVNLARRYGLTIKDLQQMEKKQKNRCALCGRKGGDNRYTRLVIDHDHENGVVRGLLCRICNVSLGILGDNAVGIAKVLKYLKKGQRRGKSR
jgi:hypothetical protein